MQKDGQGFPGLAKLESLDALKTKKQKLQHPIVSYLCLPFLRHFK